MGQSPSHLSLQGRERRRSLRNLKLPSLSSYTKSHSQSLSATFTVFDNTSSNDLLNINTASEEQLMTLPLITREIAHNIVEYRQVIGKFRRIDDLALVSGIGAEKLFKIRSEICVRKSDTDLTNNRVMSNSVSSLSSGGGGQHESIYVDLNTASIFELQNIVGVTQELAASIICYRERKGRFKSVDDLRKVRGIDPILVGVLKSYLLVNPSDDLISNNNNNDKSIGMPSNKINNSTNNCYSKRKPLVNSNNNNNNNNHLSSVPVNDIFELLSTYSHRPVVEEFFYERNNRPAFRLATWNLQQLTLDKANNLGFLEVFCRTILENRISITAIQDVETEAALNRICDELNRPKLRRVIEWEEKYHKTKYIFKYLYSGNKLGFIYIEQNDCMQTEFLSYQNMEVVDSDAIRVIIARMCIANILYLNFVNIQINSSYQNSGDFLKTVENLLDSSNIVLLGDFTGYQIDCDNGVHFKNLFKNVATNSVKLTTSTTITHTGTPALDNSHFCHQPEVFNDNILLSSGVCNLYTGCSGIIRDGLTHLAIPNGWSWGGVASEHCPVWAELYIQSNNNVFSNLHNHVSTQV